MRTSLLPLLPATLAAAALLSSACQGPTLTLDSLEQPELTVFAAPVDESSSNASTAEFEFKVGLSYTGKCAPLDASVRGTIDGQPAPQWYAGQERSGIGLFFEKETYCDFPSFHVPVASADADRVTVAFEDGTTRIAATILNLGRAQSLTVTPPPDGHIHPGSTIQLTYSPETDDLSSEMWVLLPGPIEPPQTPVPPPGTMVDLSQRQGSSVSFTIPASFPTGPASIQVFGTRIPAVAACEGATQCFAGSFVFPYPDTPVFRQVSVSFTIEP